MKSQAMGSVSAVLSSLPDGAAVTGGATQSMLDMGVVSAGGARRPNVHVRQRQDGLIVTTGFGLTIQDPAQHLQTAAVMACIAFPQEPYTLWVDGVMLTTTPQIIEGQARPGPARVHRLEILVPNTATEKTPQLHNSIIFQVIPN
ncbi:MAG TPA: hypothetical protein VKT33_13195 [Candidatus Angelobacter sp.]|nr:hypothetical protein [Candidatus Angelobacter sp.]